MAIDEKVENQNGVMRKINNSFQNSKLYKGIAGALGALALTYAVNTADISGKVNTAYAEESAEASQKDYPSDEILKEWMNQPVEKTLEGTDYTKVNDSNYQQEVLEADRPTMVLFYADTENADNEGGQRGLAALTKTLHEEFPEIKLCEYKIADSSNITRTQLEELQEDYPLETAPALLFYEEKDNGSGTKNMGKNWHLQGGIKTLDFLQDKIDAYNQYIPKRLVD